MTKDKLTISLAKAAVKPILDFLKPITQMAEVFEAYEEAMVKLNTAMGDRDKLLKEMEPIKADASQKLQEAQEALDSANAGKAAIIQEAQAQAAQMLSEGTKQMKAELEALQKKVVGAKDEAQALQADIDGLKTQKDNLQSSVAVLDKQEKELRGKLEKIIAPLKEAVL